MHEAPKGSSASHTDGVGVQPRADAGRRRPVLGAPYVEASGGRLRPAAGLQQCPWAKGAEVCRLRRGGFRPRKTGPCFPIAVTACRTHGRHFTVYPMGFVPYARERLAPVDNAGHAVKEAEVAPRREAWRGTMFPRSHRGRRGETVAH